MLHLILVTLTWSLIMEFNPTGLTIRTFQQIYDKKVAEYKAIYGDDINVEQNSPDGQKIGIEANAILDLELFGQWLYANLDADFAEGQMLNVIAKICGITRLPATRSTVDVVITTDRALTLPAGWEAKDVNGQVWYLEDETNLIVGDNNLTLLSRDWGEIAALANEVNEQNHIVLGITNITNPASATVGIDEETDAAFRSRRNLSTENPAYSTIGSLRSGISNLNGVKSAVVYENSTNVHDTALDLAPHSIWIIVDGGDIGDISEQIAIGKTAGVGEKGGVTGSYTEQIPTNLGTYEYTHTPLFDRPTLLLNEVIFSVHSHVTSGVVDLDKFEPLKELYFDIGQDVFVTSLYSEIYKLHKNVHIESLSVTNINGTYVDDVPVEPGQRFKINTLTISIVT
jgi:hypothetical protein